jgi:ubiquinone/menaquinone biosynthesis C-methylase UbiE
MQMNWIETLSMNNPVRAAIQRRMAGPRFLELGGDVKGGHVLEIGCGRGVGVEIILDQFGAARVDAFDLDPGMMARAGRRLRRRGDQVRLWAGDSTRIEAADRTYDAVFAFGVIHHLPAWRDGVAEVFRVLRPGGRFFAEESFARFICHPFWRRLFHHPQQDRFDSQGFQAGLLEAGFRDIATKTPDDASVGWFVASRPR